jgi:hypothetical protein
MKNLFIVLLFVLFHPIIKAQDSIKVISIPKFELTNKGLVQPIVIIIDSSNTADLYKKTLNWVQETYKNPEKVLKTKIENEKIRVDGIKTGAWYYKMYGLASYCDVEYSFNIEFKDNKVRLSFDFGSTYLSLDGSTTVFDYTKMYKENGKVYKVYEHTQEGMDQMMNELSLSLYNYLTVKKKSDW